MFLNIDNMKGIQVVKTILANRQVKEPSTECIIEGLEICICSNNSEFDQDHLLQKNDTATGAPNSCSYSNLALYRLDKLIKNEQLSNFNELYFYGSYRNDYFVIWKV